MELLDRYKNPCLLVSLQAASRQLAGGLAIWAPQEQISLV